MKIGLIDVDGSAAKKKKWGATAFPNLALCKISAYHKAQGDSIEWYDPMFSGHMDKVYMAKVFNFSTDYQWPIDADEVIQGGTGYDIYSKLPQEVDDCQPDLSIYPGVPQDTAYGFLTRGCCNKCPWCVVPKKEGAINPYWDIERVLDGKKKAVLMDNNILAAGEYGMQQLRRIAEMGIRVDFNQALDARLVNEENAALLGRIKWIGNTIRLGCDTHGQINDCENAIELIDKNGYKGIYFLYTMIGGGNSTIQECYERINYWRKRNLVLAEQHHGKRYFPNCQPFRDPMRLNDIPPWQRDMARWTNDRCVFATTDFHDYEPRQGFKCRNYFAM